MNDKVKHTPSLTKRVLRVVRNAFWAFLVLLIGVVALLFSGIGNQALVYGVNHLIPNVTVTTDGRPLLRGGMFNVDYVTSEVTLQIKNMMLDVRFLTCADLCFEALEAELVAVTIKTNSQAAQNANAGPLEVITLPLSISAKSIALQQFTFSQGDIHASINDFSSRFSLYDSDINVLKTAVQKVTITLPPQKDEQPKPSEPLLLPEISPVTFVTPLNWQIDDLTIERVELNRGQLIEHFEHIKLKAQQQADQISISQLSLAHEELSASLQGNIVLSENNLISLLVNLETDQHQLSSELNGDFTELRLNSVLSGLYSAKLEFLTSLENKQLPFTLSMESEHLEIEKQAQKIIVDDIKIKAKGDLTSFKYQLNTALHNNQLPALQIESEGEGSFTELNIQHLLLSSPASNLSLTGTVDWQQGIDASFTLLSDKISIEEFEPSIASDVSLKAALQFVSNGQNWRINVPELAVAGQINNTPLDANVVLALDDKLHAEISEFTIASAQNVLNLSGKIDQQWHIKGDLNLVDPETIDRRLSGQGNADFTITGQVKTPLLDWSMALKRLSLKNYRIDEIVSNGNLDVAKNYLANISLEAAGINIDEQAINRIQLDVNGDLQAHSVKLNLISDTLNVSANSQGGLTQHQYKGQINQFAFKNDKINLSNQQAINFDYDVSQASATVDQHCWLGTNTSFCLDALSASTEQGHIALYLTHLDLSVLSLVMPKTISPHGELKGHFNAKWQQGQLLAIDSEFHSNTIHFDINESFIKTDVPIEQLFFKLQANEEAIALETDIQSSVLGNIIGDIDISELTGTRPLTGRLALQSLSFANLKGFSQQIDKLNGELNANVTLSGTAFSPQIQGELTLSDLAFLAPWTPLFIEQGDLSIAFNDHSATLTGKLADNNQGTLALQGNADWQNEPALNVQINGDSFKIALEPNVWFALSPDISIDYADQFADVKGKVHVVDGRVKVKELPEGAVSVSDDELIVDAPKQQKKSAPVAYSVDLAILIDDKVRIDSFGLRSKLKGDVLFKQVDNSPLIATGEIALLEGEYRAFGQELLIETGQLIFNGAVDKPLLNVRAIRNPDLTEDGVTAGVKLTGSVEEPRLDVFSDPNMDQAMALSYLLSGRALSESNSASDGMLTQLLLARGLARGEGSISKIGEAIGIDDVSLSSRGSGEDTKVEISGYVAPGIQVRYSIGIFDSMSEVAVRYQLLPRLYIEAISGLNDSLDILYKFDWD